MMIIIIMIIINAAARLFRHIPSHRSARGATVMLGGMRKCSDFSYNAARIHYFCYLLGLGLHLFVQDVSYAYPLHAHREHARTVLLAFMQPADCNHCNCNHKALVDLVNVG